MLVTLAVAALRLAAGLPAVAVAAAVAATAAAQSAPSDAPSVIVASAERRDVTPSFFYVGRVEAIETVELVARVEGFLEQRDFREGGHVGKGDLLFLIEQAPYRIAVEQREADLAGARATLKNAEEDFTRKETLVKRKTLARSALGEARAALGIARAAVQQAQAALRRAQLDLSYTEVISPIAGQISRAAYSVGAFVRPGGRRAGHGHEHRPRPRHHRGPREGPDRGPPPGDRPRESSGRAVAAALGRQRL